MRTRPDQTTCNTQRHRTQRNRNHHQQFKRREEIAVLDLERSEQPTQGKRDSEHSHVSAALWPKRSRDSSDIEEPHRFDIDSPTVAL